MTSHGLNNIVEEQHFIPLSMLVPSDMIKLEVDDMTEEQHLFSTASLAPNVVLRNEEYDIAEKQHFIPLPYWYPMLC